MDRRIPTPRRACGALALALSLSLSLACQAREGEPTASSEAPQASSPGAQGGDAAGATVVVAEIQGAPVTRAELDAWIKEDLFREQTEGKAPAELYQFRRSALDRMLTERVLEAQAAERGVSVQQLVVEGAGDAAGVTDAEVEAFYEENKSRMGEATLDQIGPRIRSFLQQQARAEAQQDFIASLRDEAAVVVQMEAPRVDVAADGPAMGPADAPITIVEFSDYQCPFCRRAEPIVKEVMERYPGQVRLVYRHFPLDQIHPRARPAAEAAMCAHDQGKFWEYHEKLFSDDEFGDEQLVAYAEEVGLDKADFEKCLEEDRFAEKVEADLQAGRAAGVSGTPAFFVNGIMLSGAKPVDEFAAVIEAELADGGSAGS